MGLSLGGVVPGGRVLAADDPAKGVFRVAEIGKGLFEVFAVGGIVDVGHGPTTSRRRAGRKKNG